MLHRMRHAGHVIVVGEISHIDVDRGTRLVCVRIMNQQCLQLVRQPNHSVRAIVELGPLEVVRHAHDAALGHGVVDDGLSRRNRSEGPMSRSSSSWKVTEKRTARGEVRREIDRRKPPGSISVLLDNCIGSSRRKDNVPKWIATPLNLHREALRNGMQLRC